MIDFLRLRKYFYTFSLVLIVIGLVSFIVNIKKSLGIDFVGGTMMNVKFQEKITEEKLNEIRNRVNRASIKGQIQYVGGEKRELIIKVKGSPDEKIEGKIKKLLKDMGEFSYSSTYVGPSISRHFTFDALKAILLAVIAMLIYIGIRFEFRFGVAALLALIHDLIISLGMYTIAGKEFNSSTIAAFLAIAGYSVNDTIVVFDRIRENLKISRREDFYVIINKSLNQTLKRTLFTSLTTLFTCITIWIFAKGDVSNFAFALTIGIAIGTFSSDCIASPLVYEWHIRSKAKR